MFCCSYCYCSTTKYLLSTVLYITIHYTLLVLYYDYSCYYYASTSASISTAASSTGTTTTPANCAFFYPVLPYSFASLVCPFAQPFYLLGLFCYVADLAVFALLANFVFLLEATRCFHFEGDSCHVLYDDPRAKRTQSC